MKATLNTKTTLRAAVVILLAIITSTAYLANANENTPAEISESECLTDSFNGEEIEAWMVDLQVWSECLEEDPEEDVQLESWMLELFAVNTTETNEDIKLEAWMLSSNHDFWDFYQNEDIGLEDWMLNTANW